MLTMEISRMTRATDPAGGRLFAQAKKRLIATVAKLEIATTHSQQRPSIFLIATKTTFSELPIPLYCFTQNELKWRANPLSPACTRPTAALKCFPQSNSRARHREAPSNDIASHHAAPRRISART